MALGLLGMAGAIGGGIGGGIARNTKDLEIL